MRRSSLLLVLVLGLPLFVACGGRSASAIDDPNANNANANNANNNNNNKSSNDPSSKEGPKKTAPPSTTNPSSTVLFEPTFVDARRDVNECIAPGESPAFDDDDLFTLQPVDTSGNGAVRSIALSFHRTVIQNTALELVNGASGGAIFDNAQQAHSVDETTGIVQLTVFPAGSEVRPFKRARVTVIDVPLQDNAPLTARVQLDFTDGGVLDGTFSASVKTSGACANGG